MHLLFKVIVGGHRLKAQELILSVVNSIKHLIEENLDFSLS